MKICIVHNDYGRRSGEEVVVDSLRKVLRDNGHEVIDFTRTSADIMESGIGKAKAFFTGVYNWSTKFEFHRLLRAQRPDLVHVHNVFPLISPSVLGECRRAGIPL